MKILVIDDEKPTLSMFKLFLTAYGYDVHTAENGEKGLAMFNEIAPDIVFTDIKMPGIDGLEVLRRIRKTGMQSEVIIITGHGDMEKAVEALDLNASDFINKPVERQALNSALARAEKRRQMPSGQDLELSQTKKADSISIFVKGKLTASARETFASFFHPVALNKIHEIRLKFDDTFSINRSGIELLTSIIQDLKQQGVAIAMEDLSYNYVRVFQMAGLDKMAILKQVLPED